VAIWKVNRIEPISCAGQVFNSKLDRFAILHSKCTACTQPHLELKTQPRFSPVNLSLSMIWLSNQSYCLTCWRGWVSILRLIMCDVFGQRANQGTLAEVEGSVQMTF
jgi:hypothetical protein